MPPLYYKFSLLALLSALAFHAQADSEQKAYEQYKAGKTAYETGDLNRATRLLKQAVNIKRLDGTLYLNKTYTFQYVPVGRNIKVVKTMDSDRVNYSPNYLLSKITAQLNARAERSRIYAKSKQTPLLRITTELNDEDNDGLYQPEEKLTLKIMLSNLGQGIADNIRVKISNENGVLALTSLWQVTRLKPKEQKIHNISFELPRNDNNDELEINIIGEERDGYSADNVNIQYHIIPWTAPKIKVVAVKNQPNLIAGTTTALEYYFENTGNYPLRKISINAEFNQPGLTVLEQQWPDTYQLLRPNQQKQLILRVRVTSDFDTRIAPTIKFFLTDRNSLNPVTRYYSIAGFSKPVMPGSLRYQFGNTLPQVPKRAKTIEIKDGYAPKLAQNSARQKNDFALVIGNRDYTNVNIPVPYAQNDANLMHQVFKKVVGIPEEQILQLNNATLAEFGTLFGDDGYPGRLQAMVNNHPQGVETLFVYYSGHGLPAKNKNWAAYLMPSDGNADYIEYSGYSLDKLYQQLALVKARHIVVFLDACFSGQNQQGSLFPNTSPGILKLPVLPGKMKDERISILSAAGAEGMSLWLDQAKQGLFTTYLARGLSGLADEGNKQLTLQELYYYVKQKVASAAARLARSQTPTLIANEPIPLIKYDY